MPVTEDGYAVSRVLKLRVEVRSGEAPDPLQVAKDHLRRLGGDRDAEWDGVEVEVVAPRPAAPHAR